MRVSRESIAAAYLESLSHIDELELPPEPRDRIHSWHLFPIKLNLERLLIDRDRFIEELKSEGVQSSVHWRPLHLHPYFEKRLGWGAQDFPTATKVWKRVISLPIFPTMTDDEVGYVMRTVEELCRRHRK